MRTPVWRATASSASFRGTLSSVSVTVRSKGDAAAACCDRTGAVTATSNPANGIRNRMVGLLQLRSPTRGRESRRPPGPSPAGVDHLGERRESFVDGAGGERNGEPAGRHHDVEVVVLRLRTYVEAGAEMFRHAPARVHEEGTPGVVPYHEVRLAVEVDGARTDGEVPRHAQPRAHAQQHAARVGELELEALSGLRCVFAKRRYARV